jgi:peroxiredoxin
MTQEAIECYTLLKQQYPETPRGKQVDALLRRLTLAGRPLQLAGPTIDGGYISIDDFRGHNVLVVFWATDADRFVELLPDLTAIAEQHTAAGLKVIGVNLDAEEPPVDAFLTQHSLTWPQIFYSDPAKRRWENPIARYYGVQDIPTIWLVDARGVVVDTQVKLSELEQKLAARMSGTGVR